MYSVFVISPQTATLCGESIFDIFFDALIQAQLCQRIARHILRLHFFPELQPQPPGLPLLEVRDELRLSSWQALCDTPAEFPPGVGRLYASLKDLATQYCLTDNWCLDWILSLFLSWSVVLVDQFLASIGPTEDGQILTSGLVRKRLTPNEEANEVLADIYLPEYHQPLWEVDKEPRSVARERAMAALAADLDHQLDQTVKDLMARGWQQVRAKPNARHFEWLVRYQCGNQSFNKIALDERCARQSVREPVRDLASFMGLSLRKPTTGRPLGAKDKKRIRAGELKNR